jgi:hypothetical protein
MARGGKDCCQALAQASSRSGAISQRQIIEKPGTGPPAFPHQAAGRRRATMGSAEQASKRGPSSSRRPRRPVPRGSSSSLRRFRAGRDGERQRHQLPKASSFARGRGRAAGPRMPSTTLGLLEGSTPAKESLLGTSTITSYTAWPCPRPLRCGMPCPWHQALAAGSPAAPWGEAPSGRASLHPGQSCGYVSGRRARVRALSHEDVVRADLEDHVEVARRATVKAFALSRRSCRLRRPQERSR